MLTENSFARDEQGAPVRFPHVDAILLISHLQYLKWALAEDGAGEPFRISGRPFRWDIDPARPVAIVETPDARPLPDWIRELLEARPLDTIPGAEYRPSDMVRWINLNEPET